MFAAVTGQYIEGRSILILLFLLTCFWYLDLTYVQGEKKSADKFDDVELHMLPWELQTQLKVRF